MNWINRYKKKTGRLDYERGVRDERERIIEEIEKMRTAPPENAKTEVKDTFQTINNTISSIVMRIKRLNESTSQ